MRRRRRHRRSFNTFTPASQEQMALARRRIVDLHFSAKPDLAAPASIHLARFSAAHSRAGRENWPYQRFSARPITLELVRGSSRAGRALVLFLLASRSKLSRTWLDVWHCLFPISGGARTRILFGAGLSGTLCRRRGLAGAAAPATPSHDCNSGLGAELDCARS